MLWQKADLWLLTDEPQRWEEQEWGSTMKHAQTLGLMIMFIILIVMIFQLHSYVKTY